MGGSLKGSVTTNGWHGIGSRRTHVVVRAARPCAVHPFDLKPRHFATADPRSRFPAAPARFGAFRSGDEAAPIVLLQRLWSRPCSPGQQRAGRILLTSECAGFQQLVTSAEPTAHVRLAAHFSALADQYIAEAARHGRRERTSVAPPRSQLDASMPIHCRQLAQHWVQSASTLRELAAYHAHAGRGSVFELLPQRPLPGRRGIRAAEPGRGCHVGRQCEDTE